MLKKQTTIPLACLMLLLVAAAPVHADEALPPFSWDRVPVYAHVAKASGDFTDEELDFLAEHFNLIAIEKGQAYNKYGSTEEGFTVAARQIKLRNPAAKVLYYWNASLDSSSVRWGYQAATTFPEGGHLSDRDGRPLLRRGTVPNYDLRRADVRAWWSDAAATAVREFGADGIFADAMGDPPAHNSNKLDEEVLDALRASRLAMMEETREKIGPDKLIIYNGLMKTDYEALFEFTNGSMIERFGHFDTGSSREAIAQFIETIQTAATDDKVVVVKAWPGFSYRDKEMMKTPYRELAAMAQERITFPLACFLIAAQENCYFCYTWGYREKHGTFEWYPEFDQPLGPPQGQAQRDGWTYTRRFEHASVTVDLEAHTAQIDWTP